MASPPSHHVTFSTSSRFPLVLAILEAVGMKALDLLVLQCSGRIVDYRNQVREGVGRVLSGPYTAAIGGGRQGGGVGAGSDMSRRLRAARGGSDARRTPAATGDVGPRTPPSGCDRKHCRMCGDASLLRGRDPGRGTARDTGDSASRDVDVDVYGHGGDDAFRDTGGDGARDDGCSASRDTSRRVLYHEPVEAQACYWIPTSETKHERQMLRRSKSLREIPYQHSLEALNPRENPAGSSCVGDARGLTYAQFHQEDIWDTELQDRGTQTHSAAPPTTSQRPEPRGNQTTWDTPPPHRPPGDNWQKPFQPESYYPFTSFSQSTYSLPLHTRQYHAVGYPPITSVNPTRISGLHDVGLDYSHSAWDMSGEGPRVWDLYPSDAQRQHVHQEMATRFHLGRSATVDVLEDSLGSSHSVPTARRLGRRCPGSLHQLQEPLREDDNWRARVKSTSDPNIPLNVTDGEPQAEESNNSDDPAGAERAAPPTRNKRSELYFELRQPFMAARGQAGGLYQSEEEYSESDGVSGQSKFSSGRQTPIGYAPEASWTTPPSLRPHPSTLEDSLATFIPDMVDASTQTSFLARRPSGSPPVVPLGASLSLSSPPLVSPPPSMSLSSPSTSVSQMSSASLPVASSSVVDPPGAVGGRGRAGTGQLTLGVGNIQQLQQQRRRCTCRKVRRGCPKGPVRRRDARSLPTLNTTYTNYTLPPARSLFCFCCAAFIEFPGLVFRLYVFPSADHAAYLLILGTGTGGVS